MDITFNAAWWLCLLLALALSAGCRSKTVGHAAAGTPSALLRPAAVLQFRGANSPNPDQPGETDCNSPAHWDRHSLYVFNSAGHPWRSAGPDLFHLNQSYLRCQYDNSVSGGRWIECTWKYGHRLYGWYHYEPTGICPGAHPDFPKMHLTAPKIGAVVSTNNGATWHDLGIILESPTNTLKCDTKNYYFAGGNGDFSVMLDPKEEFLYLLFGSYTAEPAEQGVAVARMRWVDRDHPVGCVFKWHSGQWREPGIGGHVTPVFPATIDWHRADADAFWGPAIHWNTYLRRFVVLLNRARDGRWTQEGIYISFNSDLADPSGWSFPQKILEVSGWYPQVLGLNQSRRETDKLAGRVARLFVRGRSEWQIQFLRPGENQPEPGRSVRP